VVLKCFADTSTETLSANWVNLLSAVLDTPLLSYFILEFFGKNIKIKYDKYIHDKTKTSEYEHSVAE